MDTDQKAFVNYFKAIAEAAHYNQKRTSGEPYINHPARVAKLFEERNPDLDPDDMMVGLSTSWMHDVNEDNHEYYKRAKKTMSDMFSENKQGKLIEDVFKNVESLSRPSKDVPVLTYLRKIQLRSFIAIEVKLCDLADNMSDLKPGNLRDKYELCKHYLENC